MRKRRQSIRLTRHTLNPPMESCELQNDYPLAPDKIVIKEKMLSKYQLLTADFYNILIGHAKKLVSNFFDKENKSASK